MQCHMKYIDNISRLFIINKLYVEIFQIKKNNRQKNNLSKIFKLNQEESFELIFQLRKHMYIAPFGRVSN